MNYPIAPDSCGQIGPTFSLIVAMAKKTKRELNHISRKFFDDKDGRGIMAAKQEKRGWRREVLGDVYHLSGSGFYNPANTIADKINAALSTEHIDSELTPKQLLAKKGVIVTQKEIKPPIFDGENVEFDYRAVTGRSKKCVKVSMCGTSQLLPVCQIKFIAGNRVSMPIWLAKKKHLLDDAGKPITVASSAFSTIDHPWATYHYGKQSMTEAAAREIVANIED